MIRVELLQHFWERIPNVVYLLCRFCLRHQKTFCFEINPWIPLVRCCLFFTPAIAFPTLLSKSYDGRYRKFEGKAKVLFAVSYLLSNWAKKWTDGVGRSSTRGILGSGVVFFSCFSTLLFFTLSSLRETASVHDFPLHGWVRGEAGGEMR